MLTSVGIFLLCLGYAYAASTLLQLLCVLAINFRYGLTLDNSKLRPWVDAEIMVAKIAAVALGLWCGWNVYLSSLAPSSDPLIRTTFFFLNSALWGIVSIYDYRASKIALRAMVDKEFATMPVARRVKWFAIYSITTKFFGLATFAWLIALALLRIFGS